jgi:ribokinase
MRIAVVGSINADLVIQVPHLPRPGETVLGGDRQWFAGGKGANQALAAARLGAEVHMFGAVGSDDNADLALANLRTAGVDLTGVSVTSAPTGMAVVTVDPEGENQIVVSPGANDYVTFDETIVRYADALLLQNEIPVDVMVRAALLCQGLVVVNAAPVRELPRELTDRANVFVMNHLEYEQYGRPARGTVVVTNGSHDAVSYSNGVEVARSTPPEIEAVDSVGAGDTFTAAFAVGIVSGNGPSTALRIAVKAAALATRGVGAQTAIPTAEELDAALRD